MMLIRCSWFYIIFEEELKKKEKKLQGMLEGGRGEEGEKKGPESLESKASLFTF